jgi:2'-5' RNA ligase
MPESIRSFIAFELTNDEIQARLMDVQRQLKETGANLKLVSPENIHITMRFLGNIQPQMVDRLHMEMEQISFNSFQVEIRKVGAFPTIRNPRVIWVGIQTNVDKLVGISQQLESHLRKLGFPTDSKAFRPHITLARVRTGRNRVELVGTLNKIADYLFGVLELHCLKLKKSVLTPKGPIYTTLKEVCR